jgi:hypothetical protein
MATNILEDLHNSVVFMLNMEAAGASETVAYVCKII